MGGVYPVDLMIYTQAKPPPATIWSSGTSLSACLWLQTAADLDDALGPEDPRPVWLWRSCYHIGVANTAALAAAGLQAGKPVPAVDGGVVDVDADGNASGVLRERATRLVTPHANEDDDAARRQYFEAGVNLCLSNGLTSLQSNDGSMGAWEHYTAMEMEGTLPLRMYLTVNIDDIM